MAVKPITAAAIAALSNTKPTSISAKAPGAAIVRFASRCAIGAPALNRMRSAHAFCKTCGIYSYGHIKEAGGPYVSVKVNCLDDATVDELMSGPVRSMDGRHNNWWNSPDDTRAL
jgi:hypothetical protein